MRLSVVILNYNVSHHLHLCLDSVKRALQHITSEIIVIDNASSDDSVSMVRSNYPDVHLITNTENIGFARANNQAVKQAQGEYVCILNPDTVVPEDCFERLLTFSDQNYKVLNLGAIGVKLIDGAGKFLPESKRNIPTPIVSLKKLLGDTKTYYASEIKIDDEGAVPVLVGAFMFLKTSVYSEIGGFDEDYFMYGEDIDFSYRLLKTGYTNYYLGSIAGIHFKGESTVRDKVYLSRFYGAMHIFYAKHFIGKGIQDILVNWGLKLAKIAGKIPRRTVSERIKSKKVVLVSTNNDLKQKLQSVFEEALLLKAKEDIIQELGGNALIIWDTSCLSYKEMIGFMLASKGASNLFRFCLPDSGYFIGSDFSDQKGSVSIYEA